LLAALPTADFAGCGDREWRSAAPDYSLKLLHFARRERSIEALNLRRMPE